MAVKSNRPPRPYWVGFLKLSLVTCGVRLYTATTEGDRVKFNQIHAPSGERVRQQLVVPGLGPVERDDIVKGFEYAKGQYVTVDPEDLKRLKLESTDVIDVSHVVNDIDPIYLDQPYYLLPEGGASEQGYRVIHRALYLSGQIAIGQVVIGMIERVVAIRATEAGLLVNTLRYQDEIREPDAYYGTVAEAAVDPDEVAMMRQIISRKVRQFEPEEFVDHYQLAVRELIEQKLAGKMPDVTVARPPQVGNLMDALKASLAAEEAAEGVLDTVSAKPAKPAKPAKKGKKGKK